MKVEECSFESILVSFPLCCIILTSWISLVSFPSLVNIRFQLLSSSARASFSHHIICLKCSGLQFSTQIRSLLSDAAVICSQWSSFSPGRLKPSSGPHPSTWELPLCDAFIISIAQLIHSSKGCRMTRTLSQSNIWCAAVVVPGHCHSFSQTQVLNDLQNVTFCFSVHWCSILTYPTVNDLSCLHWQQFILNDIDIRESPGA